MGMPATQTYYMTNTAIGGAHYALSQTPPTFAFLANASGWNVGAINVPVFWNSDFQTEVARATNKNTPYTGIISSANVGNCIEFGPLNGTFLAGTWNITMSIKSNTLGTPGSGSFIYQIWKSADGSGAGTNASLLSSPYISSSIGRCTTTVHQVLTSTVVLPDITLNNEYLLFSMQWRATVAGVGNNSDINLFVGPTTQSTFNTPEFVSHPNTFLSWCGDEFPS